MLELTLYMKPLNSIIFGTEIILRQKIVWISDKVLQEKAWGRVVSRDADIGERAFALATTGGMWLKRKFGIGIDIEPGLKF